MWTQPKTSIVLQPNLSGALLFMSIKLLFFFPFSIQVSRILYSFSTAFRRSSRPADIRDTALSSPPDSDLYTFTVTLEIKEDDGKGNYRYFVHMYKHMQIHTLQLNNTGVSEYNGSVHLQEECYLHIFDTTVCVSYQPRTVDMTDKLVDGELYVLPQYCFNLTVNVHP